MRTCSRNEGRLARDKGEFGTFDDDQTSTQ
jgi:hypothetical protein